MQALHSFLSFSDIWPSGFFKVYPEALRSSRLVSVRLSLNTVALLVKKYKSDITINNNYKSKNISNSSSTAESSYRQQRYCR